MKVNLSIFPNEGPSGAQVILIVKRGKQGRQNLSFDGGMANMSCHK